MESSQYEVIQCTPAMAAEFLRHNSGNRALRSSKVREIRDRIQRGQWQNTGAPVTFGKDGTLLDGQHRLAAIAAAGRTVEISILHDADKNPWVDTGTKRTVNDSIRINYDGLDWVTRGVTAALNFLRELYPTIGCKDSDGMAEYLKAYPDELQAVCDMLNKPPAKFPYFKSAGFWAAFLVASVDGMDLDQLRRAASILKRGYGDGGADHALDTLTQSLSFSQASRRGTNGNKTTFFKTCAALAYYRDGIEVHRQSVPTICPFSIYNAKHEQIAKARKLRSKGDE